MKFRKTRVYHRNVFIISCGILLFISLFAIRSSIFKELLSSSSINHGKQFIFRDTKVSAQTSATDWPQLQHDAQRTGHSPVQVDYPYAHNWVWMDKTHIVQNRFPTANTSITDNFPDKATYKQSVLFATQMQPVVAQNQVFFGGLNGILYSVNAATGVNLWDFTTGGAILGTAAYGDGIVVTASMNGKIYALNATNGSLLWTFTTGAGINASPLIYNGNIYIGSRDGYFYSIKLVNGTQNWKIQPTAPTPFGGAPIMSSAALSEDGLTVMFGVENDYFYALDANTGSQKWSYKVNGQSFQGTWPVVKGNLVIITNESSYGTPENNMESVLTALSASPTVQEETNAINAWLNANPKWRLVDVLNITTGSPAFTTGPAIGPYSPFGMPFVPPAIDSSGRIIWPYWLTKKSTFFRPTSCYGNIYPLDLSVMNATTGIREPISISQQYFCPEIDNVFNLTTGGNNVYLQEAFRGSTSINLQNGNLTYITRFAAYWDGNDNRAQGYKLIYFGNDNQSTVDLRPPTAYRPTSGLGAGIAIANVNGKPWLFVTEADVVSITGIGQ